MKFLRSINEYLKPATLNRPTKRYSVSSSPINIDILLKKIVRRYNTLISKEETSESLENNLGIPQEYLNRLKSEFPDIDVNAAQQDSNEVLRLLAAIRQSEASLSDTEKKEKAIEIVKSIFSGKGFDVDKIKFNLHIVNDNDLMRIKNDVIGKTPEEFKEIKDKIKDENPKLSKEIDIRSIQNALTQGFASAVKDDFVLGDSEIQGVSFGDYYSLMNKMFNMYSKIPKELIHSALTNSPAVGRVDLSWNEDTNKYEINAYGYTILILVHEMVKGIYELISFNRDPKLSDEDDKKMMDVSGTQYMEREGLQYGPGLVNTFKEFFKEVEDRLLENRQIDSRHPTVMPNILARLYKLEDDLFLRICNSIFTDDQSIDKPYSLFEEYYMDAIEGRGFSRGSEDSPNGPDSPLAPTDDVLNDLLRDAGISLNMDPSYENLKYVNKYDTYIILEGYREQLELYKSQGGDEGDIAAYISNFKQLTGGQLEIVEKDPDTGDEISRRMTDKANAILSAPLSNIPSTLNDRINIEQYRNFNDLKTLVNHVRRQFKTKPVTHLKSGDINPAILQIKRILNIAPSAYYDAELEEKIKAFQVEFIEKAKDFTQQETNDAVEKFKNNNNSIKGFSIKDRIILGNSAKFISDTEDIVKSFSENIDILRDKFQNSRNKDDRKDITLNINSQVKKMRELNKELKEIKGIFKGGLKNPSGKLDIPTVAAFTYDKNISRLEGVGNLGTLKPSGGSLVYQKDGINIYRNQSKNFCIETREDFDKVLVELGSPGRAYDWCISWKNSLYSTYRKRGNNQTIYFIENVKRAEYEMSKWKDFAKRDNVEMANLTNVANTDNISKQYLDWRVSNGPAVSESYKDEMLSDPARRFYDNFHIAVVFVNNDKLSNDQNSYWIVGASNNGQWGDMENFSFDEGAKAMWPTTERDSIRTNRRSTDAYPVKKNIQVPQEIIDQPWYSVPSQSEIDNIRENIIIPVEFSEIEKGNTGQSRLSSMSVDVSTFKQLSYEDKEEWLNKHWVNDITNSNFLQFRNINVIPFKYWKELPNKLKEHYIVNNYSQLTPEMFNEIKDDTKLAQVYQEFLNKRLSGLGGEGGLIDNLKWDNTKHISDNIKNIEGNILNSIDLELMSHSLDINKMEQDIIDINKQLNSKESKDWKQSKYTGLLSQRAAINNRLQHFINLTGRYKNTLKKLSTDMREWISDPRNINNSNLDKIKSLIKEIDKNRNLAAIHGFANHNSDRHLLKDNGEISNMYKNSVNTLLKAANKISGYSGKNVNAALKIIDRARVTHPVLDNAKDVINKPYNGYSGSEWIEKHLSDGKYKMHEDNYGDGKILDNLNMIIDLAKDDHSWNRLIEKYFAKLATSNVEVFMNDVDKSKYISGISNVFKFVENIDNPKYASRLLQFIENYYDFRNVYNNSNIKNKIKLKDAYNHMIESYDRKQNPYIGKGKRWSKLMGTVKKDKPKSGRRGADTEILG